MRQGQTPGGETTAPELPQTKMVCTHCSRPAEMGTDGENVRLRLGMSWSGKLWVNQSSRIKLGDRVRVSDRGEQTRTGPWTRVPDRRNPLPSKPLGASQGGAPRERACLKFVRCSDLGRLVGHTTYSQDVQASERKAPNGVVYVKGRVGVFAKVAAPQRQGRRTGDEKGRCGASASAIGERDRADISGNCALKAGFKAGFILRPPAAWSRDGGVHSPSAPSANEEQQTSRVSRGSAGLRL